MIWLIFMFQLKMLLLFGIWGSYFANIRKRNSIAMCTFWLPGYPFHPDKILNTLIIRNCRKQHLEKCRCLFIRLIWVKTNYLDRSKLHPAASFTKSKYTKEGSLWSVCRVSCPCFKSVRMISSTWVWSELQC